MSCLLSKLSGEVANASLPKIGELIVHIENEKDSYNNLDRFLIIPNKNTEITVEVIGDGFLSESSNGADPFTTVTYNDSQYVNHYLFVSPGTYDVKFSNKYAMSISDIPHSCTNDISHFFYSKGTSVNGFGPRCDYRVRLSKLKGRLSDFPKLNGSYNGYRAQYGLNITGDLSELVSPKADKITVMDFMAATNITGDVSVLGAFYNLTSLNLAQTNITGDITDMWDAMFANGRVSGKCSVQLSSIGPTYNGEHPTGNATFVAVFSSSGWTLQS